MKDFLKSHGEKVFLVVMALVCGWSLVGSVRSLGKPSVLPQEDQDAIARIRKQIQNGRPPPRKIAPYQEWLAANFDAHGIGKATKAGPPLPPRLVYEVPEKTEEPGDKPPVDGSLGLPGKLAVEASRARITVSWAAAAAKHAKVDRYEIFSMKGKGERPETPVGSEPGGGGPFSFIHSNLAPETAYYYWVRAVAKAAPPNSGTRVKPPQEGITIDPTTGLWLTGFVGPVSGTTLSNVDFECSKIYSQLDKEFAKIVVKVWTTEKGETGWKRYETDPGVGIGGRIVGKEILKKGVILGPGVKRKEFDSGYTLKAITRENIKVPKVVWRYGADGRRRQVTIYINKTVHYVLIESKEKGRLLRAHVGKTGEGEIAKLVVEGKVRPPTPSEAPSPKSKPEPKSKPKPKDDDPLAKAKREMEGASARRPPPVAPTDAAPGERPRAPAAAEAPEGFKLVKGTESAVKVLVPKNWAAGLELDDIITGRLLMWDVSADSVAVWGGSVPGSGMVLSDKAMPHAELAALIGRPTEGLSAEKIVGLVCDALKKKSLESLAGAAARGENWSVSTKAGQPAAAFAMKAADRAGPLMVAKYFALAPGRLYTVTLFCKAGDYEAQKGVFDKIAGTLDW